LRPTFLALHLPGQSIRDVLKKHHKPLTELRPEDVVRLDDAALRETRREATTRIQDFNIARGVGTPLSADEVAAIVNRRPGN
jgi:hypothetical protein